MKPIQNRFAHKISGKVKCQSWTIVAYHLSMQMTVCGLELRHIKAFIKVLSEHSHTHSFIPVLAVFAPIAEIRSWGREYIL